MLAKRLTGAVLLVVIVAAGIWMSARLGLLHSSDPADIRRVIERVRGMPLARLSFVGVYVLAAASGIPATVLVLAGGVLFGAAQGFTLSWVSDMMAATISFGLARTFRISPRRAVPATVAKANGFLGLLRLRVIPVVPFAVLNYGSAMYGMRWRDYLAATALGIIPTTLVYSLFAASLAAGAEGAGARALIVAGMCAVIVIAFSFVPWGRGRGREVQ